jgi:hypothetical protein
MLLLLFLAPGAEPDIGAELAREVARQECRAADSDDILVCGRRRPDRYRLPDREKPFDPAGNMESVARERRRWAEGGEAGSQSCGPVGPGGWTGCLIQQWEREKQQNQWGKNVPKSRW